MMDILEKQDDEKSIELNNAKGWPTMEIEDFVEKVLVRHVGEQYAIPAFLKLLEEYELVVRDDVIDAEPIDTANLIKRINQKNNNVMSDLWEALLIKERHYSIHRGDVVEAYKRAGKFEFPWLGIDERLSSLPCDKFIEPILNAPLDLELSRTYAVRERQDNLDKSYNIEQLLDKSLSELIDESNISADFEGYFQIYVWLQQLTNELESISPSNYEGHKHVYDARIRNLNAKIDEFNKWFIQVDKPNKNSNVSVSESKPNDSHDLIKLSESKLCVKSSPENNQSEKDVQNKFKELKKGIFEIWEKEGKPEMKFFFPAKLRLYKQQDGSPIWEVITSGKEAGIEFRLSNGSRGKKTKKTIANWVTEFKKINP